MGITNLLTTAELGLIRPESLVDLDSFDLGFLAASGRVSLHKHVLKADSPRPPWWPEHALMREVMTKAWEKASRPYFSLLNKALDFTGDGSVNEDLVQQAYDLEDRIGIYHRDLCHDRISRALSVVGTKAIKSWEKQKQAGPWSSWLSERMTDQMDLFMARHPGRILHPAIEELVRQISTSYEQRTMTFDYIQQRLLRLSERNPYWDNISSIEASYLWNAEGIMYGAEHGILTYMIVNPMDDKTCEVCSLMHGTEFYIDDAMRLVSERSSITDPDAIADMFPFPRIDSIGYYSKAQLENSMYKLPPYHGNCRDQIKYLRGVRRKGLSTPAKLAKEAVPQEV